jgi:hypothetical protein
LRGADGDDEKKSKTLKHDGIGTNPEDGTEYLDEMFTYPTVDDMIEIKNTGMYKIINEKNEKDFSTPSTSAPGPWQPLGYPIYEIPIGENIEQGRTTTAITFRLIANNGGEAGEIAKKILNDSDFRGILRREYNTYKHIGKDAELDNALKFVTVESDPNSKQFKPFQFKTVILRVCDCDFTITYIDNRIYECGQDGSYVETNSFDPATKNGSYVDEYIFASEIENIQKRLAKVIESVYSDEEIDNNIQKDFNDKMRRSTNREMLGEFGTHEYDKVDSMGNPVYVPNDPNNTPIKIKRNDVYKGDWDAVAQAVKAESTPVDNCVVKRPSGEVMKNNEVVLLAVA